MKMMMKIHINPAWLLVAVCGLGFLLTPARSEAQSTGLWVDVCSSGTASYAEETVCFFGNSASSSEATASADLTECCYISEIGVDLQVLDNGNQVADTGTPGSTYESASVTSNLGDNYTATGWLDVCEGGYSGDCEWYDHASSAVAQAQFTGVQGYINPKYVVVGVTYAPPGSNSSVTYANTTSVGNTAQLTNSFQSDVGYSVSVSGSVGAAIPAGQATCSLLTPACVKLTFTESTDYTQGSTSSQTNTISKSSTLTYLTGGTPTFAPVNDDNDYVWIWINPELLTSYSPPSGSVPAELEFNGYLLDPNDPVSGLPPPSGQYTGEPDVVEMQVGCLNGDINCGRSTISWANGVQGPGSYVVSGPLERSWASATNGYQWPAGEMPNLTFNDVCQIINSDPLAYTPSQCPTQNDYTLLNSLPAGTTSDGRFTEESVGNPIQYPVGAPTEQYNATQTDTSSVAQGASQGFKEAFSVQEQFGVNWFDIFSSTTTMEQSLTLTWNDSWLNTLTTTKTLTDAFSVKGPPDPPPLYDGPIEFLAYQDNLFGTFIFVPVDYCPGTGPYCTP